MRKRWIWDSSIKELVPAEEYQARSTGFFVSDDYKPYQSMVTGEMVEGRAAHREHLKKHNLVEIGDAYDKGVKPKPLESPKGLKEALGRVVYEQLRYK